MEANKNNPILAIAEKQWEIVEKEMVDRLSLSAKFIAGIKAIYIAAYVQGFETAYEGIMDFSNNQKGE